MESGLSFSGTDKVLQSEIASTSSCSQVRVPDEDFDWYFEVEATVNWINANGFKKVALQFPDELLNSAAKLSFRLEQSLGFKPYILADTSYGSCCVDDVAAQHIEADCIIHYGDACLSKIQRGHTTVRYVLPKKRLDLAQLSQAFDIWHSRVLKEHQSVTVMCDVCYFHMKDDIDEMLSDKVDSSKIKLNTMDASFSVNICTNIALFIGSVQCCRLALLSLTNPERTFYVFDPAQIDCEIKMADLESNKVLRRRLYLIEKARDAQIVGVVIGTTNVDDYLAILQRLRALCKSAHKKCYVLFVGKLNPAKLANFSEMDIFVLLACPFGVIFDRNLFYKPIVTPFEFETACRPPNAQSTWMSGRGWRPEPAAILETDPIVQSGKLDGPDYFIVWADVGSPKIDFFAVKVVENRLKVK